MYVLSNGHVFGLHVYALVCAHANVNINITIAINITIIINMLFFDPQIHGGHDVRVAFAWHGHRAG